MNYKWGRLTDPGNSITAKTFLSSFTETGDVDLTIRRIRGGFYVRSDQLVASEDYGGVFGAIVVSDRAATVGVTAIPGPITDQDSNWMLWSPFFGSYEFQTAASTQTARGRWFDVDTKAMRTLSEDETLAFMVEPTSGANGFSISTFISVLVSFRGR